MKLLGFVYSQRPDQIANQLGCAFPQIWDRTLIGVSGERSLRQPHLTHLEAGTMRDQLQVQRAQAGVLFVVDTKPEKVGELEDLIYRLPQVEVVPVRSGGDLAAALRPHLEYYGIAPSASPTNLGEALSMFEARAGGAVSILPRAHRSANDAAAFREPRLAMYSMHQLKRVTVDWWVAKRRNPKKVHNKLMCCPTRDAMRGLLDNVRFDLSDAAKQARDRRSWMCADEVSRYFGWHLKWSLAGIRSTDHHCRIHYCSPTESGDLLYIGHCGEHLD